MANTRYTQTTCPHPLEPVRPGMYLANFNKPGGWWWVKSNQTRYDQVECRVSLLEIQQNPTRLISPNLYLLPRSPLFPFDRELEISIRSSKDLEISTKSIIHWIAMPSTSKSQINYGEFPLAHRFNWINQRFILRFVLTKQVDNPCVDVQRHFQLP